MAYPEEEFECLTAFMKTYQIPATIKHPIGLYYVPIDTDDAHANQNVYCLYGHDARVFNPSTHEYDSTDAFTKECAIDLITGDNLDLTRANSYKYSIYSRDEIIVQLTDHIGTKIDDRFDRYFIDADHPGIIIIGQVSLYTKKLDILGGNDWTLTSALIVDADKRRFTWEDGNQRLVSLEHAPSQNFFSYAFPPYQGRNRYTTMMDEMNSASALDLTPIMNLFPAVYYPKTGQPVSTIESFQRFVDYLYWKPPVSAHATKKILSAVDKDLPELTGLDLSSTAPCDQLLVQKVEDGMCVMRFVDVHRAVDTNIPIINEEFRIYVTKKEAISCGKLGEGWGKKNLKTCIENWQYHLIPFDKDVVKDTKLAYFYDILQTVPDKSRGVLLWACMVEPLIEQLSKMGLSNTLAHILTVPTYGRTSLSRALEIHFGKIEKTGSAAKRLGLSNRQIKLLADQLEPEADSHAGMALQEIKLIMSDAAGGFTAYDFPSTKAWADLSSLDDESFKALLAFFDDADPEAYVASRCVPLLAGIRLIYGQQKMMKMLPMLRTAISEHHIQNQYSFTRNYVDYLSIVQSLRALHMRTLPCEFDLDHPDDSIREMHDGAMSVYNLHQNAIKQARFTEASKRAEKWEYTADDQDFVIVAPKSADDLVNEGATLHHCVGSYVDRVCNGTTNILFLRAKDAPDQSYYTVEVDPSGTIQQVHGACNHNLDKGSPEEKFVKVWAKNKHLRVGAYNQVR